MESALVLSGTKKTPRRPGGDVGAAVTTAFGVWGRKAAGASQQPGTSGIFVPSWFTHSMGEPSPWRNWNWSGSYLIIAIM
jgi:hypothetical protein